MALRAEAAESRAVLDHPRQSKPQEVALGGSLIMKGFYSRRELIQRHLSIQGGVHWNMFDPQKDRSKKIAQQIIRNHHVSSQHPTEVEI
jgi:hypothetical protein